MKESVAQCLEASRQDPRFAYDYQIGLLSPLRFPQPQPTTAAGTTATVVATTATMLRSPISISNNVVAMASTTVIVDATMRGPSATFAPGSVHTTSSSKSSSTATATRSITPRQNAAATLSLLSVNHPYFF